MNQSFEYALLAHNKLDGQKISFKRLPELDVQYIGSDNNLCRSLYMDDKCSKEGHLSIFLLVNGEAIEINDHDRFNKKTNTVYVGDHKYLFQGVNSMVENRSRHQTYLIFHVVKMHKEVPVKVETVYKVL
jgi:hypothetical protein